MVLRALRRGGQMIHCIILAQGSQQRLGPTMQDHPKQLIPLPACDWTPIITRTIRLASELADEVVVVCGDAVLAGIHGVSFSHIKLVDPGNSSLKGVDRVLQIERNPPVAVRRTMPDVQVVLLGDVVYSDRCLQAIFAVSDMDARPDFRFVGTSNLSASEGEIWGVSWRRELEPAMRTALDMALAKHPPFETYQPGQLRRWMFTFGGVDELTETGQYRAIDDYTMDVDLPEHIPLVAKAAIAARADDLEHGVIW